MQVARAMLSAGGALFAIYLLALIAYLAKGNSPAQTIVPADDVARYEVTTAAGEQHLLEHPNLDPAGALEEATRQWGEVSSVRRLEPGTAMPVARSSSRGVLIGLVAALLLFPSALAIGGVYARGRAIQNDTLWHAISSTLTADAGAVQRQLSLDEAGLAKVIARLNAEGRVQLVHDTSAKRIYDRRLSDHTITVQFCPRCNEPINARVIADLLHVPQCPSCMNAIDRHELDRLKAGIVQGLRVGVSLDEVHKFSTPLLFLLALVFPPGAIVYGLKHA